jgi:hypothetical protein
MALRFLNSGYFAGKVGIGVENPGASLEIGGLAADSAGLIFSSPGSEVNVNFTFIVGGTGLGLHPKNLVIKGSSGSSDIAFSPSSTYPALMVLDGSAGNVGIGTTSPDSLLHVSADVTGANTGTITIEGRPTGFLGDNIATVDFHNNGSKRADIRMERGNTASDSQLVFSTSDVGTLNDALIINEVGNVGIGTTLPDFKLDVDGTFGVSDLPFNTDSVSVLVADETIGAELTTNGDFTIDADWSKGSGVTIASGVGTWTNTVNNVGLSQSITFTANAYYKCNVTVSNYSSGSFRFRYPGISSPRITANGTYSLIIKADQSTNNTLYLQGETNGDANVNFSIDNVSVKQITSASNQIQKRELGTGAFGPTPVGAYLPLAGGTMTGNIDFVNNKDISMTDNAGAVTRVMVLNTSNTMYIGPVDTYAGGSILYGVAAGVSFQRFFTGASERLRIGSNGNVAIGTTATSYRLQVEQNNNGNLLSRFHNTAANGQGLLIRAGGVSSANRILQLASENDTKVMTVNSNGRVGIGIANPTEKLEVVGNVLITAALLSNQENTDIDTGAEVVAQVSHATYTAAFFDFVVKKGTNVRSGTVYACHNGDTTPLVEFTETSTNDLGDTSDVTLSVDISGTNMRLLATVTSDDWSVKSLIRAI